MPLIARQRSRLAVLAVLALVGSLLAVSAVPVAAEDGKADNEAIFSACVGAATDDAGFGDMDTSNDEARSAANCLAHYDITVGTSEGVFSPKASVSRLQLALFLTRAAGPAGVELVQPAEDQGFTDIAGFTTEIQDAINHMAELEIMAGTSDDEFSPMGTVSRADMAVVLDGFLGQAPLGPGSLGGSITKYEDVDPDDDVFTDVNSVSFGAYAAIRNIYEAGVAKGTTDTTFSPGAMVTRAQMAVFITRALAHTNARPAGLSIQADALSGAETESVELSVSIRDEDHQPVPDEAIDIFTVDPEDDAFDDDGACTKKVSSFGGSTDCAVDASDETTDPDGNLDTTFDLGEAGSLTLSAWTGDIGDEYEEGETDSVSLEFTITKAAAALAVSDDMKENAKNLKFGDSVTFTFQVVDDEGDPVAKEDVAITVTATTDDTTTWDHDDDDDTDQVDRRNVERTTKSDYTTDEAGRVTATFTQDDPDSDDKGDRVTLDIDLTRDGDSGEDAMMAGELMVNDDTVNAVIGKDLSTADPSDDGMVTWSDADSSAAGGTLTLDQAVAYHEASEDGGGVRNVVTGTLVDQYGDPVARQKVAFYSDADNENADVGPDNDLDTDDDIPITTDDGLGGTGAADPGQKPRTSNRSGVATQSYHRDSKASMVETISATYVVGRVDGDNDGDGDVDGDDSGVSMGQDAYVKDAGTDVTEKATIMHYWATPAGDARIPDATVVVADTDANTVVVTTGSGNTLAVIMAEYNSGDQFRIGGVATNLAGFEKALSADTTTHNADMLTIDLANDDTQVSIFDITMDGTEKN